MFFKLNKVKNIEYNIIDFILMYVLSIGNYLGSENIICVRCINNILMVYCLVMNNYMN